MKLQKTLLKLLPILFIIGVWFVFSSPYFLKHDIPYPAKFQDSFFKPWSAYLEYGVPVKNSSLSDVVDEIYPWKHFTIQMLKQGQLPLWNPYSFSGTPHMANYQTAVFSPFNLLFFILPFVDAWSLMILFQPLLAGIGMYAFLRSLKREKVGALIGSISFMFCGFLTVWMAWGTLSMTIAFLPLCLTVIERSFEVKKVLYGLLLTMSLAFAFFSGHFQVGLYLAAYTFAYLLFKAITTKNTSIFLWNVLFFVLGILVALIQIIPSLELYSFSVRSESFVNLNGIPWFYLITLFAPDFYGNPVTRNEWLQFYPEWASFVGVIPFTLAFASIFMAKEKKQLMFFLIASLVTLVLSLNTPLQQVVTFLKIPVLSTSIPSRIIILASFSLAVMSSFGFDALKSRIEGKSQKKIMIPFFVLAVFIVSVWLLLVGSKALPHDKAMLALHNFVLPTILFFAGFGALTALLLLKKKKLFPIFAIVLLLLTAGDSLRFAMKWMPFDPASFVFPDVKVISAMQRESKQGRVFGDLGAFVDTYYNIQAIQGYDPLYSKYYGEFIQSASTGKFTNATRSTANLDKRGKYADRVLDLLGVSTIFHPLSDNDKPWAYPVWEDTSRYKQVYKDDKFALYANTTALPRATLFYTYRVIPNDKKLLETFYSEHFDFRKIVLLHDKPDIASDTEGKGSAQIVSYSPNTIDIITSTNKPAMLFLSDTYYPLWRVSVNGQETNIYRADYAFRAVVVPAGDATVRFYYTHLF